jgi:hypothetical protein
MICAIWTPDSLVVSGGGGLAGALLDSAARAEHYGGLLAEVTRARILLEERIDETRRALGSLGELAEAALAHGRGDIAQSMRNRGIPLQDKLSELERSCQQMRSEEKRLDALHRASAGVEEEVEAQLAVWKAELAARPADTGRARAPGTSAKTGQSAPLGRIPGASTGARGAGSAGRVSPGGRVASYRLEERIGSGGMAVVFRAIDERLGRTVALKVLSPAIAEDEEFRQRFVREWRSAAAIDDPHIIPVYDTGESHGVLYIAMRYVPGGDAGTLLRRESKLPPGRAAGILSPVASALDAAHAAGLVHRDVKPTNMLLDRRPGRPDHVYLSDFGISKNVLSSARLTESGTLLGTLAYAAPEQISGKDVDGRVDQYSLACTAFELISGSLPFPREQITAVIWAHMSESPPGLASSVPGVHPAADDVIAKALAKAPQDRYANCQQFTDALRETLKLPPYRSNQ